MLVNFAGGLSIPMLHDVTQCLIKRLMRVKALYNTTNTDTSFFGTLSVLALWMCNPHKFSQVGYFAQRVGQFVENIDHLSAPLLGDGLLNKFLCPAFHVITKQVKAFGATQLRQSKETLQGKCITIRALWKFRTALTTSSRVKLIRLVGSELKAVVNGVHVDTDR